MSAIVYKQRFYNPNLEKSAENNYYYVKYIATRDGAVLNDFMSHGLFGKVGTSEMIDFPCYEMVASKLRQISKHTNIYRGIISIGEFGKEVLKLDTQEKWKDFIRDKVYILAKGNDIPIKNLEYACAFHDKENPHLHIVFWDNKQTIIKNYVHPEKVNDIRKKLIRASFSEELRELYEEKDRLKFEIRTEASSVIENLVMRDKVDKAEKAKIEFENEDEIARGFKNLLDVLPRRGRLALKYLPEEAKAELKILIDLIFKDSRVSSLYERRLNIQKQIDLLYGNKDSYISKKQLEHFREMERFTANAILKKVKEYLVFDAKNNINEVKEEWRDLALRGRFLRLFSDIILMLGDTMRSKASEENAMLKQHQKSKHFLKNLKKMYQDKSRD